MAGGLQQAAIRHRRLLADSRGSLCSPKAGFGRIRLLPRRAAYGLSCELTQPAPSHADAWRRKASPKARPVRCGAGLGDMCDAPQLCEEFAELTVDFDARLVERLPVCDVLRSL